MEKIKNWKNFINEKVYHSDIDPFGEENWEDDSIIVDIRLDTNIEVGDEIYEPDFNYYGTIGEVLIGESPHDQPIYLYRDKVGVNNMFEMFIYGFKIKKR